MADLRAAGRGRGDDRARSEDRGRPAPAGGPRPFRPPPRADVPPPQPHTLRLRDGDREIEVSGSAAFIRQVMDEIPDLWARLHGQRPAQPAAIRMPRPPGEQPIASVSEDA